MYDMRFDPFVVKIVRSILWGGCALWCIGWFGLGFFGVFKSKDNTVFQEIDLFAMVAAANVSGYAVARAVDEGVLRNWQATSAGNKLAAKCGRRRQSATY
jgi:hypothetical protein